MPSALRLLLGGDHERCGAVVQAARVAGGDGAVLAEGGLQASRASPPSCRAGGARPVSQLARGDELVGEVGRRPALLRAQGERVLVLARDAPALGDVLARLAHRLERELRLHRRVREAPAQGRVVHRPVAAREGGVRLRGHERRAAHRLDAAGHEQVAVAGGDRVAGADDGREAGRAEPIHGHSRNRVGQPREQRRHPGDVAVVLARLVRAAEVDVLDLRRVDAGALDRRGHRERRQVVRPHSCQAAAVAPDRRPHRREHDRAAHAGGSSARTSWATANAELAAGTPQ